MINDHNARVFVRSSGSAADVDAVYGPDENRGRNGEGMWMRKGDYTRCPISSKSSRQRGNSARKRSASSSRRSEAKAVFGRPDSSTG